MAISERLKPYFPDGIQTSFHVTQAIKLDRPQIFSDINMPFENHSYVIGHPFLTNHFSYEQMGDWVNNLEVQSERTDTPGKTSIFGETYKTLMYQSKQNGLLVAKRIFYETDEKEKERMVPCMTYGLYGSDPDSPLGALSIEVTRYSNYSRGEHIDIYKTSENIVDPLQALVSREDTLFVRDFLEEKVPTRVRLSIADPGWTDKFQEILLQEFGLMDNT